MISHWCPPLIHDQEAQQRGCGRREEWEQLQKPNLCRGLVSAEVLESQREMPGACEK